MDSTAPLSFLTRILADRDWDPAIDRDTLGVTDAVGILGVVDEFCRRELASPIAGYEFFASSVSSVHGVRLGDDRRVVIKVHRSDQDRRRLRAIQELQQWMAGRGFPAPTPVLGPTDLGHGTATVETMLTDGAVVDGHSRGGRELVAAALWSFIALGRGWDRVELGAGLLGDLPADVLWPTPHDRRFDFDATRSGAEWIDEIAWSARRRRDQAHTGEMLVGHLDWRIEHLRFSGTRLAAVYDWESVMVGREPLIVGSAAHGFTADWSQDGVDPVPSARESLAFIRAYERARHTPFTLPERRAAVAALVYATAYGARCQHSDRLTDHGRHGPIAVRQADVRSGGYIAVLATHGRALLAG